MVEKEQTNTLKLHQATMIPTQAITTFEKVVERAKIIPYDHEKINIISQYLTEDYVHEKKTYKDKNNDTDKKIKKKKKCLIKYNYLLYTNPNPYLTVIIII